jgi:hypothetical protein
MYILLRIKSGGYDYAFHFHLSAVSFFTVPQVVPTLNAGLSDCNARSQGPGLIYLRVADARRGRTMLANADEMIESGTLPNLADFVAKVG